MCEINNGILEDGIWTPKNNSGHKIAIVGSKRNFISYLKKYKGLEILIHVFHKDDLKNIKFSGYFPANEFSGSHDLINLIQSRKHRR